MPRPFPASSSRPSFSSLRQLPDGKSHKRLPRWPFYLLIATVLLSAGLYSFAQAQPNITIADVTQAEGESAGGSGTTDFDFTVTLSTTSSQTVTVNYATRNNSAVAPSDYTLTTGTVTFNVGETTKTFAVPVNADSITEGNESFIVDFTSPVNARLNNSLAFGTITPSASIIVVTNTNDSGAGSLRQAITDANATAGANTIHFDITAGSGVRTINLLSALPTITDPVIIDGTTQPGFSGTPLIELNGASASANGLIISAGNSTVRGLVINRFNVTGIVLQTAGGNRIEGNFIGTNAAGTADLGNIGFGVDIIGSPNNIVGGTTAGTRNLISGNNQAGVRAVLSGASGNRIEGNFIGTDVNGVAAIGNSVRGVLLQDAPNNIVGGTAPEARNVISGNGVDGILIFGGGSTGNLVQGNYVGLNAAGASALPNTLHGVSISSGATGNTIGGTAAGARNIISGNTQRGVFIDGNNNVVEGNYIGTNAAGTATVKNSFVGLTIAAPGSSNRVGGPTPAQRNVISGNDVAGVSIESIGTVSAPATGNLLQGNFIGVAADGTTPLGNTSGSQTGPGVIIIRRASNNTIDSNVIAHNAGVGVFVGNDTEPAGSANGNRIVNNSIFNNGGLGILLVGGNNNQAAPALSVAFNPNAGGNTAVRGTLFAAANTAYNLQLFSNAACDPSGAGEGQSLNTVTTVTTNASGFVSFVIELAGRSPLGQFITATATDPAGNTSRFSNCRQVVTETDVAVTTAAAPETVTLGENVTFTSTVTNQGPNPATGVRLIDTLPAGAAFVSAPDNCTRSGSAVTCTIGTLAAGATSTVSIVVRLTFAGTFTNNVRVELTESDPDPSDNFAAAQATVNPVTVGPNENLNFESGDFRGWNVVNNCGTGSWNIYSGTTSPNGFTLAAPPEGTFAATTDQSGPGTHLLYRDFTLAAGQTHTLSFNLYYRNRAQAFVTPDTLSCQGQTNQQYRVDILNPGEPVDSVAPSDVLAAVFRTNVGDPLTLDPTGFNFDLTPFAGRTVRVRFAEVDNQSNFQASVDDVRLTSAGTPTFTISGRITDAQGNGITGVTVALSSTQSATTTTDANGNYSFANLAAGGNYTVTPTSNNFAFTPPSSSFTNLQANQTANFTGTARTPLGPSAYLSQADSPFIASINAGTTVLENFEDGQLNTPGVTASTGSVIGPGGATDSVDGDDGAIDGSGTNGRSFFSGNGAAGITFTFNAAALGGQLPTQAGIVWTDGSGTTTFEAFDAAGVSLGTVGPVAIADGSTSGTTAEDRFFGIVSAGGISVIRISNTSGGIEVDHLQYGQPGGQETLTFPTSSNGEINDPNYGDRFPRTPNVVVDYGPAGAAPRRWTTQYGDLVGVLYEENDGFGILEISFVADPGFRVNLSSFDMGGWPDTDRTINSVQVIDVETGAVLFSQNNVLIQGDFNGPRHTTFNFPTPLTARVLRIRFDAGNLGGNSDDVGIDNIVFSQVAGSQPVCIAPPANMVAWYPGDGDANDIQGGNNGTLQNGATFAPGMVMQAFSFDGTNDRVVTNLDVQPSAMPTTTWDAWVFPTRVNHPVRQTIMSDDNGGFDRTVLIEAGTANFGVFTGNGVWQPVAVDLNQWQHITVIYSPTNIEFYKNGVRFSLNAAPVGQTTGNRFTIGSNPGFPNESFRGLIDEVEVFNRALTQTEIQSIVNAGSAGKCRPAATLSISGTVRDAVDNIPLAGATVNLSGTQTATVTTDANGNYSFTNLAAGGNYTVTPSLVNYTFTPPSATFNNLSANQTANFIGTRNTHSISGNIRDTSSQPLGGVVVTLSGGQSATTTTDAAGNYSFANLPAGANYTVTPARQFFTFAPPSRSFNNLNANQTGADFTGTLAMFTISGRITDNNGASLSGVPVMLRDDDNGVQVATQTDASGNYSFNVAAGSDYIVTPQSSGFTFDPAFRSFLNLSGDRTGDFVGTGALTISGQIANLAPGQIVTVVLSGASSGVTTTDASGNYSFAGLPRDGDYTVTPVSNERVFNPPSVSFNDLNNNMTANFMSAPNPSPTPTPPIVESFGGPVRDPEKFSEGTLTQPPGSTDPQVTVVQQNGQLVITPRAGISDASFNGYVTARAVDFTNAEAAVEVVQTADNGAQTIFAIGSSSQNFFRFVAQDSDPDPTPTPAAATSRAANFPAQVGLRQLIFQVSQAGVFNSLAIPYDPVQHRFWRFRHDAINSPATMNFETSPTGLEGTFTVRFIRILGGPIGSLATELAAGTAGAVSNPGQAIFDGLDVQPQRATALLGTFSFAAGNILNVSEGVGSLRINIRRTGSTTPEAAVEIASEPFDNQPCNTPDGKARPRCDYSTTVARLRFAPGEMEKTVTIFITDDSYQEGTETFRLALGNPTSGYAVEEPLAVIRITDNDAVAGPNPINTAPFLVRQQYLDFLYREPEAGGFQAWVGVLQNCAFEGHIGPGKAGSDPNCDRITVSSSFFRSQEFQIKGYFVIRFYRASLGRLPTYEEFLRDMASISGQTDAEVNARLEAFAGEWVKRADFRARTEGQGLTNEQYVDYLAATAGVTLTNRGELISDLETGRRTRAEVLRVVVDNAELFNREYNAAFVLMQYFGYLQRDPDPAGYQRWLDFLNASGDFRTMIFGFLYSQEYLMRFGPP